MASSNRMRQLQRLAQAHGVQTSYRDVQRRRRQATADTLLGVLRALGVPLSSADDASAALEAHQQRRVSQPLEPVLVAWDGRLTEIPLHAAALRSASLEFTLLLEDGTQRSWSGERIQNEGDLAVYSGLTERVLPSGYHRLTVEAAGNEHRCLVISAPKRSFTLKGADRTWGIFVPLYALASDKSWGAGNYSDLQRLWQWTTELGGGLVATLPLLAAFLEEPYEPSPYAPASRLFWNEFYLDVRRAPELAQCEAAQRIVASADFQHQLRTLQESPWVDYRQQYALQRQVLMAMADCCFDSSGERRAALESYCREKPELERYAQFRAYGQRDRRGWMDWPDQQRDGQLSADDYDRREWQYHVYVQWLAHEQVRALSEHARRHGPGLYLDLPLGVHRQGYDTWCERDVFALEASGGAPPDAVFTKGQDWGFAPLHPQRLRQQGYRHFIEVLRHHLAHAGMLRIDHVMGLHRLYWIPAGMPASAGAYVRYPAEELHAILSLESHRFGSTIVGENLGTVPATVNTAMKRHAVGQMYVVQYEANAKRQRVLPPAPRRCVASLNTHDMPPFAAFWTGRELDDLQALGLFTVEETQQQRGNRDLLRERLISFLRQEHRLQNGAAPDAVVDALHAYLAGGESDVLLVNLEDLWLEEEPQNMPGTSQERKNWQRKIRYALDQLVASPQLRQRLSALTDLRNALKPAKWPVGRATSSQFGAAAQLEE